MKNVAFISQEKAIEANQLVHTAVSHRYNESPHFRPENREKVRQVLTQLIPRLPSKNRLLDMGCGTGFILSLSHDLFNELHGVDVTEAMLAQVDLAPGNIKVHVAKAETTPFKNDYFDMVSAYSFIDHLADLEPFLVEVFRVLKPSGLFYSDLNPNRGYWDYLFKIEETRKGKYSAIVEREIANVVHNDKLLVEETGLPEDVVLACESTKNLRKGFCTDEVTQLAKKIGFSGVEFHLDWYMGQGPMMHEVSFESAEIVDSYLRKISPASDFLFKYLRIILIK